MKIVSVIISNFNYGSFICQAIDSALAQTYKDTQVIVVDDGSTDQSSDLIKGYGSSIQAVFIPNSGQAAAWNVGMKDVKGDIVIFLDADDVLLPTAAEQAVSGFKEGVVKVHWPLRAIDRHRGDLGRLVPATKLSRGNLRDDLIRGGPDAYVSPPTSGNAWLCSYLSAIGPFPEEVFRNGADFYPLMFAPFYGRVEAIEEPLSLYRIHGHNGVSRVPYSRRLRMLNFRLKALQEFLESEGAHVDLSNWKSDYYFYVEKLATVGRELENILPLNAKYMLWDLGEWGQGALMEHASAVPFLEKNHLYGGLPADDTMAIAHCEAQRRNSIRYMVIGWPAFWCLDYYKEFTRYLEAEWRCLHKSKNFFVYEAVENSETRSVKVNWL